MKTAEQQLLADLVAFFEKAAKCKHCSSPLDPDAFGDKDSTDGMDCHHGKQWNVLLTRAQKLIKKAETKEKLN